jgi:putative transposase
MIRARYPTDLTDRQWRRVAPHLPAAKAAGRPQCVDRRDILDAILSVLRNGSTWRALPHDVPPWRTVSHSFRRWRRDGTGEAMHAARRDQVRAEDGREASPSAAIIDRQSVKTTDNGDRAATTPGRR